MMQEFWSNLSRREKVLIILSLLIASSLFIYLSKIEPAYRQLEMLRQQVPGKQRELSAMENRLRLARPLLNQRDNSLSNPKTSLLTRIEQSANNAGLTKAINRIQPQADGQVRLWLNEIYFDPWLLWTKALRHEKIEVTATSITRVGDNKVNIRVTLKQY